MTFSYGIIVEELTWEELTVEEITIFLRSLMLLRPQAE